MTATLTRIPALTRTQLLAGSFALGRSDAQSALAPLYTYPADIDLYASDDAVAAYIDGYESVSNPV
jgi:hypothetical protein